MSWYTGAATLEHQINVHDEWESDLETDMEYRERAIEEDEEYLLIPEGDYMDFGWSPTGSPDDLSDTGDWVNYEDCDVCGHEEPSIYSKKTHRLYHLNEDNEWELCPDDGNYADSLADPTIPDTCPSYWRTED